ncbi:MULTISPECIES: hypothetical protein [Burkholderia]|uniref:Uncharacterized protein n=1 Tax=Burkholderia humptydooensis TaxID=430531 RepID=A0A7T2X066_9BURK|nr:MULTISPECIES: hypothetical protein [Burkholderia]AGK48692.1 hypothetical protein BTI_2876 [Burkholderia thailandensis MSMB121]AJY41316.1 hypothetical protein BW21_3017 [Burkholderia sp. 2002721687]QPS44615.1 hypothetical protein I6G56_05800 [Burkholderia humptydooensis]
MQGIVLSLQNALSLENVLLGLGALVVVGGLAYAIRSIRLFMKIGNDE